LSGANFAGTTTGGTMDSTAQRPYIEMVIALALLLLRETVTNDQPPAALRRTEDDDDDAAAADSSSMSSFVAEPVMQSVRFDGRRMPEDDDDYRRYRGYAAAVTTVRRLDDRMPSLCERCRCVHARPANFRLLLLDATRGGGVVTAAAAVPPSVDDAVGRLSAWKTFTKALRDIGRRVQRLLTPRRR